LDIMTETRPKRGFAAMSRERRAEISRLGGLAIPKAKRFFSRNREAAARIGRKGGERRREANAKDRQLLLASLTEPVTVPHTSNARLKARVSRLLRLGYWEKIQATDSVSSRYRTTPAGKEYLEKVLRAETI
jgi:hypothetical protein